MTPLLILTEAFTPIRFVSKFIFTFCAGFGESPSPADTIDRAEYLDSLIACLGLTTPVIISPHVSGFFSQPYLFKSKCHRYSRPFTAYGIQIAWLVMRGQGIRHLIPIQAVVHSANTLMNVIF